MIVMLNHSEVIVKMEGDENVVVTFIVVTLSTVIAE